MKEFSRGYYYKENTTFGFKIRRSGSEHVLFENINRKDIQKIISTNAVDSIKFVEEYFGIKFGFFEKLYIKLKSKQYRRQRKHIYPLTS